MEKSLLNIKTELSYLESQTDEDLQIKIEKLKKQIEQLKTTPQNNSLKNFNALANQILNTDIKVTDGPNKEIFVTKKDLCGNIVALEKEIEEYYIENLYEINENL